MNLEKELALNLNKCLKVHVRFFKALFRAAAGLHVALIEWKQPTNALELEDVQMKEGLFGNNHMILDQLLLQCCVKNKIKDVQK